MAHAALDQHRRDMLAIGAHRARAIALDAHALVFGWRDRYSDAIGNLRRAAHQRHDLRRTFLQRNESDPCLYKLGPLPLRERPRAAKCRCLKTAPVAALKPYAARSSWRLPFLAMEPSMTIHRRNKCQERAGKPDSDPTTPCPAPALRSLFILIQQFGSDIVRSAASAAEPPERHTSSADAGDGSGLTSPFPLLAP